MASLTKAQANAAAVAEKDLERSQANALFITAADAAIANAIALGKFDITLTVTKPANLHDLLVYYSDLGYKVSTKHWPPGQPAELFGPYWVEFWTGMQTWPNGGSKDDKKIKISWK